MLSENACGSPAETAYLPALGVLAQRGEPTPVKAAPMGFLSRMHRSFRQQPMSRELSSTRLLDASARPRAARDPSQVAMTDPNRTPHEPAPPVASNGTESDGEVRT